MENNSNMTNKSTIQKLRKMFQQSDRLILIKIAVIWSIVNIQHFQALLTDRDNFYPINGLWQGRGEKT